MTRNNTPSSKEENLLVFIEISRSIYRICYFWILLILLLYCLGSESQRYSMNGLWISMPVPILAMALELQVCRYIISHKFWDQSPFPYYQCCLQVSETVSRHKLCQYAAILSRGKGPDLFLQSGPFQNFHKFSRNWLGLNNLCKILPQNLRKLGKENR